MRKRLDPATVTAAPAVNSAPRRAGRKRRICVAAVGLFAVVGGAVVSSPVAGQESADGVEVRIVARKLDTGRIEFGLQQRQPDDTWGDRQLPNVRFFPTTATVDRWLASSPLELTVGDVRIVARKLETGRIEFGLQQRQPDDTWGDRQLPNVRFFPTTAGVNRWLASSPLTLTAPRAAGGFSAVSTGGSGSCAVRTNGTITCWGAMTDGPEGRFSAVTAGLDHSCGLRTDGTITCWGANHNEQADAPAGQFSAVTAGDGYSCGLRTDDTIACWGNNYSGRATAPDGQFSAVTAAYEHSCGLRTDDTIACWGNNGSGQADAPHGQFSAVSAGTFHSCGLHTDGTISCWGGDYRGQADAPHGQFSAVSAGHSHSCALRTDDTIACWGSNSDDGGYYVGQLDAPDGQFSAVSAGHARSCGLRTDGTLACWPPPGPPSSVG